MGQKAKNAGSTEYRVRTCDEVATVTGSINGTVMLLLVGDSRDIDAFAEDHSDYSYRYW